MDSYQVTIEVAKPAHAVFQCITRDVAKWWGGKDLTGSSEKLHDEFIIEHPGTHYSKQQVVELIPDKKIGWLVTESRLTWLKDQGEWTNTRINFDVTNKGGNTVLRLTHEGLTPDKESYATCCEGWNTVIKDYLFHFAAYGRPHF